MTIIPFLTNYRISRTGGIIYIDKDTNEVTEIETYFKKYLKVVIDGVTYRVDELILRTYVGIIDFPIVYIDGDRHNCCLDNLKYDIVSIDYDGEDYIYLNNTSIAFKRIDKTEYFISRNGILYSKYHRKLMTIKYGPNDYCCFSKLRLPDTFAHRLVYLTWTGPIEEGLVIDHIDGNKWNNDISNLEMVTYSENNSRAYMNGLKPCRWTPEDIHFICKMMTHGYNKGDICNMFDISITDSINRRNISYLINDLKNGSAWSLITQKYDLSNFDNSNYRYSVLTDRDKLIIENLLNRGYGTTEISRIMDLKRSTVLSYARKIGMVESRKKSAA